MIFIRYFRAGLGSGYQQRGEPASPLCTTSWRGRTHWGYFGRHSTLPIFNKKTIAILNKNKYCDFCYNKRI